MTLYDEIVKLIDLHQEGIYWDFKKKWYVEEKISDMLIDIICMANNLANRDAYIIIGIDEKQEYTVCDVSKDPNRRNTQKLTDFLGSKKFAGDFRPVIAVEPIQLKGGLIDVIVVKNSLNTPFFLKERYQSVNANNIYVRLQDSNTPCDKSADFHHVEYLWKKRFGMLLTPVEKVKLYLTHPEEWEDSPTQDNIKYYKFSPEYTIEFTYKPYDHRDGYVYYLFAQTDSTPHWSDIIIRYHQTVLADLGGIRLDGGRCLTAMPNTDGISLTSYSHWDIVYRYMIKGELNYLVNKFYYKDSNSEERYAHDQYEGCLLIFENRKEQDIFKGFAKTNWPRKTEYMNDIWVPHMEQIPGYKMEAFKEEYINVQILRNMLKDFRNKMD